jgi:uncharacterized protein (TIGR03435 family)
MRHMIASPSLAVVSAWAAFGQSIAKPPAQPAPAFEVASVKVAPPRAGSAGFTAMDTDPAMVRYSNVTLKLLIAIAYRLDGRLIQGGPAWLDDQLYDLAATLPPRTPKDRVPAMFQTLLAERFHMAVHRETKEERVYFLLVGKNGTKLREGQRVDEQDVQQVRGDRPAAQIVRGGIMGHSMVMGSLAGTLARVLGYQVVDHTGLTGTFDINLKWTPEDNNEAGPSLFTAIQEQLGLKLEPGKAAVEVLVVDHADRIPTGN